MDKQKAKAKIIQKVPLKSKLILKSTISEKAEIMTAKFAYEDSLVAAGYSDGKVRIFNMNTDNKISQIDTCTTQKVHTPVNCLRWRPALQDTSSISSVLLVGNTNGNLYQYVAKTGKQQFHTVQEGNFIMTLDYAKDGKSFCTAGKDCVIRVYDQQSKKIMTELKGVKFSTHGHQNRIFAVVYKPDDSNIIVSGGWDHNINIWDIRQSKSIATLYGPKISGQSVDIKGDMILTGANRGIDQVELWDWKANKVVKKFAWDKQKQQTNAFVYSAQFCHNSNDTIIAVGGSEMKMFSIADCSEMLEVKIQDQATGSLYTCDSGYSSNKYLVGGKNGTLYYFAGVKSYQ